MSGSVTKLRTTLDKFEALYERTEGSRGKVRITRQELLDLLMDHSTMVGHLQDDGRTVTDGVNEAPLPARVRRRQQ